MLTVYLLSRESSDLLCAVLDIDISLGLMTHVTLVTGEQGHNEGQRSTVSTVRSVNLLHNILFVLCEGIKVTSHLFGSICNSIFWCKTDFQSEIFNVSSLLLFAPCPQWYVEIWFMLRCMSIVNLIYNAIFWNKITVLWESKQCSMLAVLRRRSSG